MDQKPSVLQFTLLHPFGKADHALQYPTDQQPTCTFHLYLPSCRKTQVHKITNVPFCMGLGLNDFHGGKSITTWTIRRGPPLQMGLEMGPPLPMALPLPMAPHQSYYVPRHINSRFINNYRKQFWSLRVGFHRCLCKVSKRSRNHQ
jgi:hypothetical protein